MKRRGHVGGEVERRRSGDQDDAGASGGRGSESGGDPGPKAKLQRRISVAEVRRGFGTTAAQGVQGLCSGRSNLEAAAGVWATLRGGMAAQGVWLGLRRGNQGSRAGFGRGARRGSRPEITGVHCCAARRGRRSRQVGSGAQGARGGVARRGRRAGVLGRA